jgi:hypothetical protein
MDRMETNIFKVLKSMIIYQQGRLDSFMKMTNQLVDQFKEQLNVFDRNKIGYNFVFMFASPSHISLKTHAGEDRIEFEPISYKKEYKLIKNSLRKAKKEIIVHKVHGTTFNFMEILER